MNDDAEAMESAIQAFRSALLEFRQDDRPLYWATAQGNLGVALSALGEMTGDKGMLAEAVEVMRASLDEATRERDPFNWGLTQYNIGRNLTELGRLETGVTALQAAYAAQGEALKERTRARNPFQWAVTLEERSALLLLLHERTGDLSYLDRAIVEATEAISGYEEAGDAESATALKEQIDELSAERAPPRP
jgi:tetratricopeptide (TPR) repeat protein